jgi:hypothetical protein
MLFSLLAYFSPIISGRARWAGTRHAQIGPAQEWHGPKIYGSCLAREALWAVLGPLLLPVGRHSPTRESAWPVKHGGPHGPLAARPTTGPDTPIKPPCGRTLTLTLISPFRPPQLLSLERLVAPDPVSGDASHRCVPQPPLPLPISFSSQSSPPSTWHRRV